MRGIANPRPIIEASITRAEAIAEFLESLRDIPVAGMAVEFDFALLKQARMPTEAQ